MQTLFGFPMSECIITGCVALVLMIVFGGRLLRFMLRFNKRHKIVAFNDKSVDSLYAWDEDDDI